MGKILTLVVLLICALSIGGLPESVNAQDGRNCPIALDQYVIVGSGPAAFSARVENFNDKCQLSIFQYPLGGILEQPGPTPLDFLFVPETDFRGTTTFSYRLTVPRGCGNGTILKTVTLARGTSESTASGVVPPPTVCGAGMCGAGMSSLMLMPLMLVIWKNHHRSATRRKKTQLL
jgi:hypothetical protein